MIHAVDYGCQLNLEHVIFFKRNKPKPSESPRIDGVKARFWGASDRMVCCEGIDSDLDEFNVTSHDKLQDGGYVCTLQIKAPDEPQGLYIHCFFSGHWSFAVSPSNEDYDEMPKWHLEREWGTVNSHSETLIIYCPEGSRVDAIDRIEAFN